MVKTNNKTETINLTWLEENCPNVIYNSNITLTDYHDLAEEAVTEFLEKGKTENKLGMKLVNIFLVLEKIIDTEKVVLNKKMLDVFLDAPDNKIIDNLI